MPEKQKNFTSATVFPSLEEINQLNITELVKLKILLEKFENLVAKKIRSIIQT